MSPGFRDLERQFFDRYVELDPVLGSDFGLHQYDGKLPAGEALAHEEQIRLLSAYRDELRASPDGELDVEAARYFTDVTLLEAEQMRTWSRMPLAPDTIGSAIFLLLVRDSSPLSERLEAITQRLADTPRYLRDSQGALQDPVRPWCEIALGQAAELPALFQAAVAAAEGSSAQVSLRHAAEQASDAVGEFEQWLRGVLPRAREFEPLGEQLLDQLLRERRLPAGADEILELGRRYLAEADAERAELIASHWPGATLDEVRRQVRSQHAPTFGQALDEYRQSMSAARSFVEERGLATIPRKEVLQVVETPSFLVSTLPFAAYFQAAHFDARQVGIYVVTPPQEGETLGEHNRFSIQNTSVHEAYPGHHLQFVCANQNPSLTRLLCIQQTHEFIEGWAHYCEQLMYEEGFSHTPDVRFIQLNDILWRACRIIIDIELTRGRMTPAEAVSLLVERAAMEPRQATAEVNRYTYTPGYQLSYLYGKHLLLELRDKIRERSNGAFSLRAFHDRLLYAGCLPAALWERLFDEPAQV